MKWTLAMCLTIQPGDVPVDEHGHPAGPMLAQWDS